MVVARPQVGQYVVADDAAQAVAHYDDTVILILVVQLLKQVDPGLADRVAYLHVGGRGTEVTGCIADDGFDDRFPNQCNDQEHAGEEDTGRGDTKYIELQLLMKKDHHGTADHQEADNPEQKEGHQQWTRDVPGQAPQEMARPGEDVGNLGAFHQMGPIELEEIRAGAVLIEVRRQSAKLEVTRSQIRLAPDQRSRVRVERWRLARPDCDDKTPKRLHRPLLTDAVNDDHGLTSLLLCLAEMLGHFFCPRIETLCTAAVPAWSKSIGNQR